MTAEADAEREARVGIGKAIATEEGKRGSTGCAVPGPTPPPMPGSTQPPTPPATAS